MSRVSEETDFGDVGKLTLERLFEIQGSVETPLVVFERDGIIEIQRPLLEEEDHAELHRLLLSTIVDLIRRFDPPALFVGYEGFHVREEMAVRVLVGTLYSDDEERVWLAQTHGRTVGEWREISDNPHRFGFEGLFKAAKAYRGN